MEITVKGKSGSDAKIAMKVDPKNGTTVITGTSPNAELFKPSLVAQKVGTFPKVVEFTFILHRRPWSLDIEIEGNTNRISNRDVGLQDSEIITPDIFSLTVNFKVPIDE